MTNREVVLKYRTRACVICVFTGPGGHDVNSDGSCNGNDVCPGPCKGYTQLQATGHFNLLYTVHAQHNLYNTVTVLSSQHRLDGILRTVTVQQLHLNDFLLFNFVVLCTYYVEKVVGFGCPLKERKKDFVNAGI